MKGLVISLFDLTGNFVMPWVEAGYDAYIVDVQHPRGIKHHERGYKTVGWDLHEHPPLALHERPSFVAAFPPCTHLAVSGARWFKGKGLRKLAESIDLFATAAEYCEQSGAPYLIENPVSTISTYWRKPDFSFHPHDYTVYEPRDNYTKKTCLWVGNGFVMPEPARNEGLGEPDDRIHKAPPSPDRADIRSATPMGFARAVFEANA